ncbi:hypothetical protein CBR64_20885 [Cellulosimicrobium cellulans]|uniref:Uncharacterized protein n=1 Tax=Cellulosimicrobium cellulans TaxID=1710 RepID=A0A1Y0I1U9_CELCE|nr:hypothetical protein CBR64_20885 [Cellulosimicrobium cellulans]
MPHALMATTSSSSRSNARRESSTSRFGMPPSVDARTALIAATTRIPANSGGYGERKILRRCTVSSSL